MNNNRAGFLSNAAQSTPLTCRPTTITGFFNKFPIALRACGNASPSPTAVVCNRSRSASACQSANCSAARPFNSGIKSTNSRSASSFVPLRNCRFTARASKNPPILISFLYSTVPQPSTDFHSSLAGNFIKVRRVFRAITLLTLLALASHAAQFSVGTYNLELYLDAPNGTMRAKPDTAKAKIREAIKAMNVDVLAVQEMGAPTAFAEFTTSLRAEGLNYPHTEFVQSADPALHVAVLSRHPITARRSHTNESFLLNGRRMQVLRGFAEVDIQVGADYQFTLLTMHLKSKRQTGAADEEEVREQEALILREKIDAILRRRPNANIIILGDLNDFRDARSTRAVIGRGQNTLIDTRPAERNGDTRIIANEPASYRQITWTHFYSQQDTYARLDYILLSRGMSREWLPAETYILTMPNWGQASDHRPLVATFSTIDK